MTFPPKVWDDVLRRLRCEIPAGVVDTWLGPVVARCEGDAVSLLCPSAFHRDRVRSALLPRIDAIVGEALGRPVAISLDVADAPTAARARFDHRVAARARDEHESSVARENEQDTSDPSEAPAPLKKADDAQLDTAPGHNRRMLRVRPPSPEPVKRAVGETSPLPEQRQFAYTFDNFVVGPCNALAREASVALALGAQRGLEQLYLNSPTGLGKTHLCRAAARAANQGAARVVYTSAEDFTTAFTAAVRAKQMTRFKQRFRKHPQVLVFEDVHFLAGKTQTQLELFHTVRHLLDSGGRVLLSGDRLPHELTELEDCLREQLHAGFVAELSEPDCDVRRNILRAKASAGGVRLPEDCLEMIVGAVRGNVRELEGALIQLVTTASLLKRPIDAALTREALDKKLASARSERAAVDVATVVQTVASFFRTTPEALASRSRRRDVGAPRQLAMYLCRRYTSASLSEIGAAFGRNHPSVRNAITRTERAILERAPVRYQVEALSDRLDELRGR